MLLYQIYAYNQFIILLATATNSNIIKFSFHLDESYIQYINYFKRHSCIKCSKEMNKYLFPIFQATQAIVFTESQICFRKKNSSFGGNLFHRKKVNCTK